MSCFDDGQYTDDETYPCECGGIISLFEGTWSCSKCNMIMGE